MGIQDPRLLEQHVDRDHECDRRRHAGRQHPDRERLVASKRNASEPIGRHGAEDDGEHGRDRGDDDAVDEEGDGIPGAEDEDGVVEVLERRLEPPHRRPGKDVVLALERGDRDDVEGEEAEAHERARRKVDPRVPESPRPSGREQGTPTRSGAAGAWLRRRHRPAASDIWRRPMKMTARTLTTMSINTASAAAYPTSSNWNAVT